MIFTPCNIYLLEILDLVLQYDAVGSVGFLPGHWDAILRCLAFLHHGYRRRSWEQSYISLQHFSSNQAEHVFSCMMQWSPDAMCCNCHLKVSKSICWKVIFDKSIPLAILIKWRDHIVLITLMWFILFRAESNSEVWNILNFSDRDYQRECLSS